MGITKIYELEKYGPGSYLYDVRDQLRMHVYGRSEKAYSDGDADRDAIDTIERLGIRKLDMRSRFIECIGGLPSSDTPLDPQIVGSVKCDGFTIEKIVFQSRPDTFVTANLYLPDGIIEPRGAVLFVCGHHEEAKHVEEYQIVCRHLVKAGLVVLAQDPIGQGERLSYYEKALDGPTIPWGVQEHDYVGSQTFALGDGLARYFVHDGMRGIDYLISRPEVDPAKIGVTGNSGGGTQTSLMMICDPRVAAAAPCTFIMDRRTYMYSGGAQDAEQVWPGMTALGFDHEDILLMMCPKPVRVLAVTSDFFPIEGTRSTVGRCKRFWEMHGVGDHVSLVEDDCTHMYTTKLARSTAEFFSEHLLGQKIAVNSAEISAIAPQNLWCTQSGQVSGEIEGARAVHDENVDRLAKFAEERTSIDRAGKVAWLKERVFAHRRPCDINPRRCPVAQIDELYVEMIYWWSQEGLINHAFAFRDCKFMGQELPVTIAVWDGGTSCLQPHVEWIRENCSSGRTVMVLDTSGAGLIAPNSLNDFHDRHFYGAIHKLADDLFWLDDSLAALRVYDVTRALDMLALIPGVNAGSVRLYAHGRHGVYARLAAVIDERVERIDVKNGMSRYADWVGARYYDAFDIRSIIIPGLLRHLDLPEIEREMH